MMPTGMPARNLKLAMDFLGPLHHRLLAGDGRQVLHGRIQRLGLLGGLAHADVQHHLAQGRHLHDIAVAELPHQRRNDLLLVSLFQCGHVVIMALLLP